MNVEADMGKILAIYNCDKFIELLEDIYELVLLYNVDESDDWVKDAVGEQDTRSVRQIRTAYLLAKLAHHHADSLKRVKRVAPGLHQQLEKISKPLALSDC